MTLSPIDSSWGVDLHFFQDIGVCHGGFVHKPTEAALFCISSLCTITNSGGLGGAGLLVEHRLSSPLCDDSRVAHRSELLGDVF